MPHSTVQRIRGDLEQDPPLPNSVADLVFPEQHVTVTIAGVVQNVKRYDSGQGAQRIVMFWSEKAHETLMTARNFAGDGTFQSAPTVFDSVSVNLLLFIIFSSGVLYTDKKLP